MSTDKQFKKLAQITADAKAPAAVLYHGSQADVAELHPQAAQCQARDRTPLPPYVYAQPDLKFAHAYALKQKGIGAMITPVPGRDDIPRLIVVPEGRNWRDALQKQDGRSDGAGGGFIYTLDAAGFVHHPERGEWLSPQPQRPLARRFVGLEDVLQQGVQLLEVLGKGETGWQGLMQASKAGQLEPWLQAGMTSGNVRWLNRELNLTPIWPLGVPAPQPAPRVAPPAAG